MGMQFLFQSQVSIWANQLLITIIACQFVENQLFRFLLMYILLNLIFLNIFFISNYEKKNVRILLEIFSEIKIHWLYRLLVCLQRP